MKIHRSITIRRSPEELYSFWQNVEHLAELAPGNTSAKETSSGRSRWSATGPAGRNYEWETEITHDVPNREIAWRSLPGGDVSNSGSVHFQPSDSGEETRVELEIEYTPPGGLAGRIAGALVKQHVEDEVDAGLQRAKRRLERGSTG